MKRSRLVIIIAVLTALVFCFNTAFVGAASLSQIRKDIKETRAQKAENMDSLEEVKENLAEKQELLDSLDAEIEENEVKLKGLEEDLEEAEADVEEHSTNLNARLRTMYKNGNVGFIDVLLESTSFSEFLTNLDLVEKVYTSDKDLLEELQDLYDEIADKKAKVEDLQAELKASRETAEESKTELEAERSQLQQKDSKYYKEIQSLKAAEAEKEAENARIEAMLQNQGSHSSGGNKGGSGGGGGGGATVHPGGSMAFPLKGGYRFSSDFGWRTHPIFGYAKLHTGVDLAAPSGTPIYAARGGVVLQAWYTGGYGNQVLIDHGGGIATRYAHCSSLNVRSGQRVSKGQHIANVGSTGNSTGPHLHFEVRRNGAPVDPKPYIGL